MVNAVLHSRRSTIKENILSGFWKRKRGDESEEKHAATFVEWAVDSDFFTTAQDPSVRTKRLLMEIQKRSLAEQVVVLSRQPGGQIQTLHMIPSGEHLMLNPELVSNILFKTSDERRILTWEDFAEDPGFRSELQRSHCSSLLFSPISAVGESIDALMLVNYSAMGGSARVMDFVSFVSSVLSLSLQNTRLFNDLKHKNEELKAWTKSVEERIEEETKTLLEKEIQYTSY